MKKDCPICHGYGEIEKGFLEVEKDQLENPRSWTYHKMCPACSGEGEIEVEVPEEILNEEVEVIFTIQNLIDATRLIRPNTTDENYFILEAFEDILKCT